MIQFYCFMGLAGTHDAVDHYIPTHNHKCGTMKFCQKSPKVVGVLSDKPKPCDLT